MIKVFSFYPDSETKVKINAYRSKRASIDYMNSLKSCGTPYVAFNNHEKQFDCYGGHIHMTRGQMAVEVMKEANRLEQKRVPYADSSR